MVKVLRNRLLVTLVFAAIVLALGSSAALASIRSSSWATGTTSVSRGDRPAATPTSGEPDVGGAGAVQPPSQQKGLTPLGFNSDFPQEAWRTWISRIWASWSLRGVR